MNEEIPPGYLRDGPDAPEPPPVPASHPAGQQRIREGLRIPAAFYVEALFGFLVVLGLYLVANVAAPVYAPMVALFFGVAAFGVCFVRMVRRVIIARRKGRPPLEATVVFWITIVLPVALGAWYANRLVKSYDPVTQRQAEAKATLREAFKAERDFFQSYGHYTYSIKELGLAPAPGARYVLGFAAACTAKYAVEGSKNSWDLLDFTYPKARKLEIEELFKREQAENCPDPKEGFEIFVVGVLLDDKPLDVWKTGAGGKLVHVQEVR